MAGRNHALLSAQLTARQAEQAATQAARAQTGLRAPERELLIN